MLGLNIINILIDGNQPIIRGKPCKYDAWFKYNKYIKINVKNYNQILLSQ